MNRYNNFTIPSYWHFAWGVSSAFSESWQLMTTDDVTLSGWMASMQTAKYSAFDLVMVVVCSVVWTILRLICSKHLFQKLASRSGLKPQQARSLPECLWKLSFYILAWLVSAYLVLSKYHLFSNPVRTITDWSMDIIVPLDLYLVYLGQISFYVHSIYTTLFLDKWRKDSVTLLLHHVVTIILISGSYAFRYVYLGLLVLFLHDFSDIFLESTKVAVYYKSKGGKWETWCDAISAVGFVIFGVSWFLFRLYWFPLKVIYVTTHLCRQLYPDFVPPIWFLLNGLLLLLLILHVYWFKFIVDMAIRIVSGKAKQVEDVREYEESSHITKHKPASTNGFVDKRIFKKKNGNKR